jgi:hypothetical protein
VWHVVQLLVLAGCVNVQAVVTVWHVLHAATKGAAVPCGGVWQVTQSVLVGCVIGSQATPACV